MTFINEISISRVPRQEGLTARIRALKHGRALVLSRPHTKPQAISPHVYTIAKRVGIVIETTTLGNKLYVWRKRGAKC